MDVKNLDVATVDRELDRNGYLVIRDSLVQRLCEPARREYERALRVCEAHAPSEKFHYSALDQGPWRKLAIGSRNGIGDPYAQNLQSIYFSANHPDYPALGELFRLMIGIRNALMRVAASFGSDPGRDRFWDACRVHHYPRGGGFMARHRDTHFPQVVSSQIGKPFYQVMALLSRKDTDFFTGGGFVEDSEGKKIDLELEGGFGSLVIFDGRVYHGVDDVDLDRVIDFDRADGRLAAFVNLYSTL